MWQRMSVFCAVLKSAGPISTAGTRLSCLLIICSFIFWINDREVLFSDTQEWSAWPAAQSRVRANLHLWTMRCRWDQCQGCLMVQHLNWEKHLPSPTNPGDLPPVLDLLGLPAWFAPAYEQYSMNFERSELSKMPRLVCFSQLLSVC